MTEYLNPLKRRIKKIHFYRNMNIDDYIISKKYLIIIK